jgi:hypothetical protein
MQTCLTASHENPAACAEVLNQFDALSNPPFPPGTAACPTARLIPLAPLPYKPPPPDPNKCCPSYRK